MGGFVKPFCIMTELYWIERMDSINGLMIFLLIAFGILLVLSFLVSWVEEWDEDDIKKKGVPKTRKMCIWILSVSILVLIFVPSTKEMYRIIGIGGTIDYLRKNETAKQLPDKCIKAVDLFLDKMTEGKKDESE